MNVYAIGIVISMAVYLLIGSIAGQSVKDVDDYFVAGRRAPTALIVGSLVASFLSTGVFMGDTGEVYSGFFMPIVIVGVLQSTGYLFGAPLFGIYIRRTNALTIPEFFGKRFCSKRVQRLAGIITIFSVTAYMLSALQGISALMSSVTGLSYQICVFIAWMSFALFTIWAGSSGVLITDTLMFLIFLMAAMIGVPFIVKGAGGWNTAISNLAVSASSPGIISAGGNLSYLYPSARENLIWAFTYGVVWALVVMISPWQTSRYLMAKNEETILKSSVLSSVAVVAITTVLYFSAAFVQSINPDLIPSQNLIWAAMNVMPKIIGVILLTGILAAGISSASTFLSLIGFSVTNDIAFRPRREIITGLRVSRLGMIAASFVVLLIALFNPPQIFWIMYFGGTVIASAWTVVALGSVWSGKLSAKGAYWGMLLGFLGCVGVKVYGILLGRQLPVWADSFFCGILLSLIGAAVGSKLSRPTQAETNMREQMLRDGESETDYPKLKKYAVGYMTFAALFLAFMIVFYVIPYNRAVA